MSNSDSIKGSGHVVCVGDDVDTDMIIAGRYLRTKNKNLWAEHAFEDYDPTIAGRLPGSVIVAGKNFGCGSSREQAAAALRATGVKAVVAKSFARIFFRNAINLGIPLFEVVGFECRDGDEVSFDLEDAVVECGGRRCESVRLSDRMNEIIAAGGLIEYLGRRK
jgi:methanogen homoaconitase small subunit